MDRPEFHAEAVDVDHREIIGDMKEMSLVPPIVDENGGEMGSRRSSVGLDLDKVVEEGLVETEVKKEEVSSPGVTPAANAGSEKEEANMKDVEGNVEDVRTPQDGDIEAGDGGKGKTESRRNGSQKNKKNGNDADGVAPEDGSTLPSSLSTIQKIASLKHAEVSITSSSMVQVTKSESSGNLAEAESGSGGGIDLLRSDGAPAKSRADSSAAGGEGKKKKKRGGKGAGGGIPGSEEMSGQRAARQFNRFVRACVERSDADSLREILRDRKNHQYALDAQVLETVIKAYVVAAMFDEALYCLRNCALPGTLDCSQSERILLCLPQNLRNSSAYTAADMIDSLCIATAFDAQTSRAYFLRVTRGIALEFLEEATSARDRICSAPCERLVRSAMCVVDARLRRGKKATELVVQPGHQLGVFMSDAVENRGIQAGDAVGVLPYAGPYPMSAESLDRNMIEATAGGVNPLVLRLQDKTNASLHAMLTEPCEGNVYRVDKLANRMGFNRQLSAAVFICSPNKDVSGAAKANAVISRASQRRPSSDIISAITAMDDNIDQVLLRGGNANRDLRGMELTSTAALCARAIPWNASDEKNTLEGDSEANRSDEYAIREASALALEKYGALEGLNASQRMAVEGAATNRLTLVQGPPGTGKTAVAIRILQHWARLAMSEAGSGNNPTGDVRRDPTGGKGANPILATSDSNIAVDNLVEGCANAGLKVVRLGRPEAIRPELLRFCIDRPGPQGGGGRGGGMSQSAFKEKMKVLKSAQVICCTCIGSGSDILDNFTFERVLVDEATQATEPAVLVPLTRGCRQLVLVGDHCQLPPTVLSTVAEEEGLGVPLFSRLVACGVPPFMLDTQYRMHPGIAMFPSDLFYGGKLRNGVSPPERRPLAGFPWPREEFPVAFVPVHSVEVDDGVSKVNEAEAAAACDAVAALLAGGSCAPSDIAVVTPYAAQVRLIRRLTRRLSAQASGPPYVEVSSTDGFQGREKEAVVFSAVRSNDYGAVGFVSDWRRVNVSFTRARRALIVIGDDRTLRRGDPDTWGPWLAWADAHGINMDKPGMPRGRYDPEQLRKVRGGTTAAEMLKDVLARQRTQIASAETRLARAEVKAAGHIMGKEGDSSDDESVDKGGNKGPTLEEDLALLSNQDGNWDDSDDEGGDGQMYGGMTPSISRATLSSNQNNDVDTEEPVDAWDL